MCGHVCVCVCVHVCACVCVHVCACMCEGVKGTYISLAPDEDFTSNSLGW